MEKEKVVALCSGGFDSIVMLNDLARNPLYDIHVLFFDYGQRNCMQEKKWVEAIEIYRDMMKYYDVV